MQLTVPKDLLQKERLEFHWDADNEGLIWTEDGHTVHGLTGGGERVEWILPDAFRDGKEHIFYIEMEYVHNLIIDAKLHRHILIQLIQEEVLLYSYKHI